MMITGFRRASCARFARIPVSGTDCSCTVSVTDSLALSWASLEGQSENGTRPRWGTDEIRLARLLQSKWAGERSRSV